MINFDLKKAATRDVKEKSVQSIVCRYAVKLKLEAFKVTIPGRRGASDYLFVGSRGNQTILFFIEFKRPKGGKISALQGVFRKILLRHGASAYVCKDADQGKKIVDQHVGAAAENSKSA